MAISFKSSVPATLYMSVDNGKTWNGPMETVTSYTGNRIDNLKPERVIFNPPYTICIFPDGEKTVVKCSENEIFVEEYGVMACILKKLYGNRSEFLRKIKDAEWQVNTKKPLEVIVNKSTSELAWYVNSIGEVFQVVPYRDDKKMWLVVDEEEPNTYLLKKCDCTILG